MLTEKQLIRLAPWMVILFLLIQSPPVKQRILHLLEGHPSASKGGRT